MVRGLRLVSKVGTPVDNQVGVWTGDGTIEGTTGLTFNASTSTLAVSGSITVTGTVDGVDISARDHDAVTLGTANGLSLSTQALSLAAASSTVTGALTSTNWTTFNNKLSDVVNDTTPQLGGNLDLNQKSILLDQTPSSDHTVNGLIVSGTAGEILAYGNICYYKSDGKFWKADMNASSTASGWLAYSIDTSVAADASGSFLVKGYARDDSYTWTTGSVLYLGAAGAASSTAPTGSADIVRIVGYAVDGSDIFFNPGNDYLELT
jgi:hypothetical protein